MKTLTLAGTNFMPRVVTHKSFISEKIQNTANTCNIQLVIKTGQTLPSEGSEIVYKDGARFLFGGYLTRTEPVETGEGQLFTYDIEATDYSWIFGQKVARKAYTNATLKAIVEDLLSTYLDASYGFTTTNVQTGPTIDSITFDHISLRRCFEKLSKRTGFIWWVDYEKNLYFQDRDTTEAGEVITDSSDNFEEISLTYDTTQVRNSIIVIGSSAGEESESLNVDTFTADGETRSWQLDDKPSTIQSITLGGVSQQFSLDLNERDTDTFVYNFNDKRVYLTDSTATPSNPTQIVVTYYPRIPIIKKLRDTDSIATMAALDGGDGVFEYTIKEPSITSKAEAQERAQQELNEFADPLLNGVFKTRTSLLAGTIFAPGEILRVTLPSWGISTESAFLIQQVDIEMVEDEPSGTTEYIYTVRFGGKVVDIETFLAHIADDGGEVEEADLILTVEQVTDAANFEDSTPTTSIDTPPYKVGPGPGLSGPIAVVNKSTVHS